MVEDRTVKIGICGKPSSGKSTFFKAATLMDVDIANYPFTTIDANSGFAHVRIPCVDDDLDTQCEPRTGWCTDHNRYVPFELIDVAGLVPDAHKGRGRGLAFLSDLNEANALIHIIDASGSTNAEGEDVAAGTHDPAEDVRFLEHELDQWYLSILEKNWKRLSRKIEQEKTDVPEALAEQLSGLRVTEDHIKDALAELGLSNRITEWTPDQRLRLCTELRKKSKPMVIAANKIDKPGAQEKYDALKKQYLDHTIVPCSAEIELALREAAKHGLITYQPGNDGFDVLDEDAMSQKQREAMSFMQRFLDEHESTGVQDVLNAAVLDELGYIAVYPGGAKKLEDSDGRRLPDCFLLPRGTTTLDFARHLHTDFAENFIRAVDAKTGRAVGKDHELEHRDVIEIVSGK